MKSHLAPALVVSALFVAACPPPAAPPSLDPIVPTGVPAVVKANPTSPNATGGGALSWASAPEMTPVSVAVNKDSAVLILPAVTNAVDYRAFEIPANVQVNTDLFGNEDVRGTVIHCAGYRQHNAPVAPRQLLRQLEVHGLSGPTTIVIEAIDATCPFPGAHGSAHATLPVDNASLQPSEKHPFEVYTGAEITSYYGSLIVNGHGPAGSGGASLGLRAPPIQPKVLARTTIEVTPTGTPPPGVGTFFSSFDDESDQPVFQNSLPGVVNRGQQGKLFTNSQFAFYTWNADLSQFFIERGRLHSVIADWSQEIFGTNYVMPKRTFALSDTNYLHAHFEIASDTTARRYWWFSVCGAETMGQTLTSSGLLKSLIVQTSFFYQDDGRNPSLASWNCFQLFPLDGSPFPLDPTNTRPESDIRVLVNQATFPPDAGNVDNVRRLSPDQYGNENIAPRGWYRQMSDAGDLGSPVLDDQMLISPRANFDLYLRRDRVIMYVNGEQRLCNDFPNQKLTMAEGVVGFANVLYHTGLEHPELVVNYNDRSGQIYYLNNAAFVDERTWDNLGLQEGVGAPTNFDPTPCYVTP